MKNDQIYFYYNKYNNEIPNENLFVQFVVVPWCISNEA